MMNAMDQDNFKDMLKKKDRNHPGHGGCGNVQPVINRKDGLKLMATFKRSKSDEDDEIRTDEKRPIMPQEALDIFRRISDQDLRLLGLNISYARPDWMIITVMPVPPPPVRPGVSVDGQAGGQRSEDDLTHKLGDIIRANANIKKSIQEGLPQHIYNEFFQLLQYHIATFMDNSIAGVPPAKQKGGRDLKTLRGRLKGKEGRLRGNLMGKRVNFSARTVITGDANLDLDEVGVPISIAKILTFPETVTPFNIAKLHQLVRNGPNMHPGARYIERESGERIDLRHHKRLDSIQLGYGWVVERHIMNGDYIIFNRQPSLHKESMMGHRVRVMPFSTFRLNLSVTTPYNADFDGDEMNLHVPQSQETRAEVQEICAVPLNIVSPQRNGPLMGIVQDSLCGIFKICRRDNFITKDQVMNLLPWVPDWDGVVPPPAILKPVPKWTGKQIISLALPKGLNLDLSSDPNDFKDGGVLIQHGELICGRLNKKVVGVGSGGVVHNVYNELGWEAAVRFFNTAQRLVTYWLLHNGFSIGIGDTVPDQRTIGEISKAITDQKTEVEKITKLATSNQLEALPGMNIRETFESKVSKALNDAREIAGTKTAENLKDFNNAVQMSKSGSKGSNINISQMTALVGQQSVEGKRVPFGFSYRSLPHFTKDDYSPEARGFVENSYLRGLTPQEFFFHAMAGREGLIDTAVKTAETGYIQRRLVKALEDVMVKYDGTVRNSLGDIIQFVYGEDGMDGQHIERQPVDLINCSDEAFETKFRVDVMDPKKSLGPEVLTISGEIAGDVEVQQYLDEEYEQLLNDREVFRDAMLTALGEDGEMFQLPLNIMRTIETAKARFRIKKGAHSDLHPKDVILKVRQMLDNLVVIRGDDPLTVEAQHSATMLVKGLFRCRLAFKRLVQEHSLNTVALDYILGDIESRFLRAQANPGEMVGVLAAQSIGEPATQMTLNTFHFTGISSKNVTLGVPRLKEILNVAMNIKTPSMLVYQDDENKHSQQSAKRLRSLVEHTTLRSVTDSTEIYYDPVIEETVVEADEDLVAAYFILPDSDMEDPALQSKWMLRIVLGRRKLLDKGLTVSDVATRIKEDFRNELAVIFSDNNADEQVIRIRLISTNPALKDDDETAEEDTMLKKISEHILSNLTIRGVEGIDKAFIDHKTQSRISEDGSIVKSADDKLCEEWFLNTSGTSFKQTLSIDGVDPYRTYTNSFGEIFDVLGIEATRAAMARELWGVLSFDGSYVNHRHLALLVDVMCTRGFLMAITRHGINRADTGALMRCSFEETVEILLDAAAAGEIDDCRGISENVMLGQLAPLGTGEMEVLVDQELMATATTDDARFGLAPGIARADMNILDGGAQTPYDPGSPVHESGFDPSYAGAAFSPIVEAGLNDAGGLTEYGQGGGMTPLTGGQSPYTNPTSPWGGAQSPYRPTSPWGPTSPYDGGATSPIYQATSPSGTSPTSPLYTPGSPYHSPGGGATSPSYSPTSPSFSPTSPQYSPTSPSYSPASPAHTAQQSVTRFSPKSPYSPTSPAAYSPASPIYRGPTRQSPTSPMAYSPASPSFQRSPAEGNQISPTSPAYSPTSPAYSPSSPQFRTPP
jgi:DNA-directed RNA polymerase II subunit RPB1